MSSKRCRTVLSLVALCSLAACGNYSNDDLDYQLALPQQSDVGANVQLSQTRLNSAPYFRDTRNAITSFNTMVTDMLALIEHVRGYAATTRLGNRRIWGPFPADKYPTTWQIRVVMDKSTVSATLLHMDYWVQVRPVGTDDSAWVSFLAGSYESSGSARTGTGDIHLLANAARVAGYPVNDDPGLVDLDHLDVHYENAAYPKIVNLSIVNLPTAKTQSGVYSYAENQDGSGSMSFDWQGTTAAGLSIVATMKSQWLSSGAGRADLTGRLASNTTDPPTLLGTDCWDIDTTSSYTYRTDGSLKTSGSAANCVF